MYELARKFKSSAATASVMYELVCKFQLSATGYVFDHAALVTFAALVGESLPRLLGAGGGRGWHGRGVDDLDPVLLVRYRELPHGLERRPACFNHPGVIAVLATLDLAIPAEQGETD